VRGADCKTCVSRASGLLRALALAILFGGSGAIVFAAVVLVKAAQAQGVPATEAATANAPVFIQFSRVLLGAGVALLVAEALDFAQRRSTTRLAVLRYTASLLCVATTMIFALGIVPPMAELLPIMKSARADTAEARQTRESVHASFRRLHEISRIVFGSTILLALISLTIPTFESSAAPETKTP